MYGIPITPKIRCVCLAETKSYVWALATKEVGKVSVWISQFLQRNSLYFINRILGQVLKNPKWWGGSVMNWAKINNEVLLWRWLP